MKQLLVLLGVCLGSCLASSLTLSPNGHEAFRFSIQQGDLPSSGLMFDFFAFDVVTGCHCFGGDTTGVRAAVEGIGGRYNVTERDTMQIGVVGFFASLPNLVADYHMDVWDVGESPIVLRVSDRMVANPEPSMGWLVGGGLCLTVWKKIRHKLL